MEIDASARYPYVSIHTRMRQDRAAVNLFNTVNYANLNYCCAASLQVRRVGARHGQPMVHLAVVTKMDIFLADHILADQCATAQHGDQR